MFLYKKKKKTRALDNSLSSQCLDPILTPIVKFIQKYDVTSSYELWNLLPCFSIILVSGSSLVTYISVRVCWAELIFYIHFFLMSHFFHYINVFLLNLFKKKKKSSFRTLRLCLVCVKYFPENKYFPKMLFSGKENIFKCLVVF